VGSTIGEGQTENSLGRNVLGYCMSSTLGQGQRLASADRGEDKEASFKAFGDMSLAIVQSVKTS